MAACVFLDLKHTKRTKSTGWQEIAKMAKVESGPTTFIFSMVRKMVAGVEWTF
jgi:hypothetical protein